MGFFAEVPESGEALIRCDCDQSDIDIHLTWETSDFWGPPGPMLEFSGRRERRGWTGRLREAWVVLRRGFPWTDMLILDKPGVVALRDWLTERIDEAVAEGRDKPR